MDVCGPNLQVGLHPVAGDGAVEWVAVGEDSQKFRFEGVGPGNYTLKVTPLGLLEFWSFGVLGF